MSQNTEQLQTIGTINVHKEPEEINLDESKEIKDSTNTSCSTDELSESSKSSPMTPPDVDYKSMSILELKQALLASKLEMLEAQEAVRQAKENILRLNEEEYLKLRK